MQVQEIKESIATMSAAELAEVEAFIRGLMADRGMAEVSSAQNVSFEDAAKHVRTDYVHLLQRLSQ